MFKCFMSFCILLVAGLFLNNICSAATEITSLSCDQVITAPGMPQVMMKFYMKDKDVRIETEAQGKKVVMIKKGDRMISYYPDKNMAMELPVPPEALNKMNSSPFGKDPKEFKEYLDKMNLVKLGEEVLNGKKCEIYEFPASDKGKMKVWVYSEYNWPAKAVMSSDKGETIVEYKNLKVNESVDESLFSLPAGVQIMNMGSMMQGAQQMMNDPKMQENMKEMMNKYKNN